MLWPGLESKCGWKISLVRKPMFNNGQIQSLTIRTPALNVLHEQETLLDC